MRWSRLTHLAILLVMAAAAVVSAQTGTVQGYCNRGSTQPVTQGLTSVTTVQGLVPQCVVTVYLTGTTTLATIYADSNNTPLTNPFTATISSVWLFYASISGLYDVVTSGGIPPNAFTAPVTLTALPANAPSVTRCHITQSPGQYCLTSAPFYASGSAQTTTTIGSNAPGGTINIASCIDFVAGSAGTAYGHQGVSITDGTNWYVGTATACSGTVLSVSPSTGNTFASGATVRHDDTAALQLFFNLGNATTAVTGWLPGGVYNINGVFQNASHENSMLIVPETPYFGTTLAAPFEIALRGVDPDTLGGPQTYGAVLQTVRSGTSGALYYGSMLSGYSPSNHGLGNLTNVDLTLENVTFRSYDNPQITAINAYGIARLRASHIGIDTGLSPGCGVGGFGIVCNGASTTPTQPTNSNVAGIVMPYTNAEPGSILDNAFVMGYYYNIVAQEHTHLTGTTFSTWGYSGLHLNVVGHSATVDRLSTEHNVNNIDGQTSNPCPTPSIFSGIFIEHWEFESASGFDIYDPNNCMQGTINYENFLAQLNISGGVNLALNNTVSGGMSITSRLFQLFPTQSTNNDAGIGMAQNNLSGGNHNGACFGAFFSTNNCANLQFDNVGGGGSANNLALLGLLNATNKLSVDGNGNTIVHGNLSNGNGMVIPSTAAGSTGSTQGQVVLVQVGTTGSIGGSPLTAGNCASGTVTITQSATSHPAVAVPNDGSFIGGNYIVSASVSGTTVTVNVCAVANGTPTAKLYNVTVF